MDERVFDLPEALWRLIERTEIRLIFVIGASDTGKTTFIESLARRLSGLYRTGIVDLDMGQSHIGPPTTVGWAIVPEEFADLSSLKEEELYFTGSITPVGNLLPSVTGAKLMTERALQRCEKVIVDTTGLISEPSGRVLKQFKIDLLRPDTIICLEREYELNNILEPYRYQDIKILTIKPPDSLRHKSPQERADYRYRRMLSYLQKSTVMDFLIDEMGIIFMGERHDIDFSLLKNRIVSLRDSKNNDMAIGVIEEVKQRDGRLYIRAPEIKEKPCTIIIGRAVFDRKEQSLRNVNLSTLIPSKGS